MEGLDLAHDLGGHSKLMSKDHMQNSIRKIAVAICE